VYRPFVGLSFGIPTSYSIDWGRYKNAVIATRCGARQRCRKSGNRKILRNTDIDTRYYPAEEYLPHKYDATI